MLNVLFGTKTYTVNFKPMFRKVADHVLSVLKLQLKLALAFCAAAGNSRLDKIAPRW